MDRAALAALGGVLGYVVFQWGGVVRTGRYEYLLALGLLAIMLSLGRSRDAWAPLPGRVVRWAAVLLPAYVLVQVVPLPVAALRVLSPARAEGVSALDLIGAKVNLTSLSVSPGATFQSFLLVCGYSIIFLLVRELTWRFEAMPQSRWRLRVAPVPHAGPARAAPSPATAGSGQALKGGATANAALKGGATASQTQALRYEGSCWLAIWPIVAIGALEAGLGLCQYFSGSGQQVRWGTYANHNHYAGFLEMALPFAVVYPGGAFAPRALARALPGT